eukprot:GILI01027732.1.p2 GENE.GILI01027732.1~~GILI01027732.1.p2  ORF type:complete len:104 (-),score=47.38 GILI01027732.1:538-819(-)
MKKRKQEVEQVLLENLKNAKKDSEDLLDVVKEGAREVVPNMKWLLSASKDFVVDSYHISKEFLLESKEWAKEEMRRQQQQQQNQKQHRRKGDE